jgi:uncharacterized protein
MNRSTKIKLALCAAAPLLLGATLDGVEVNSPYTRLTLSGKGYASQSKEFVTVSAATQTFSKSASRAMSENATDMSRLRARLKQMGVNEDDFRTTNFQFNKGSDPDDHNGDRDEGFIVQHQLSVVIRETDKAGGIMDALVAAGAKNLSVGRYWGYSDDISPEVLKEARAGAIRDAQSKADDYARALGMKIRRVVSISDQGGYSREEPRAMMRASAVDSATQIESRPATVLASVGMVFELDK